MTESKFKILSYIRAQQYASKLKERAEAQIERQKKNKINSKYTKNSSKIWKKPNRIKQKRKNKTVNPKLNNKRIGMK